MTKLDFNKPDQLQTRDGRAVRIYATDCGGKRPIQGAVFNGRQWCMRDWKEDGRFADEYLAGCDLVRKPARIKGWVNVYPSGSLTMVCSSQGECRNNASVDCLGQIYIDAEIQS